MNKQKQEDKPLPEGAVVSTPFRYSGAAKLSKLRPKFRMRKKPVVIGLLICVLIAGAFVLKSHKPAKPEPIALQVGKYSYTQSEYNKRIAQAKDNNVSEYEARKALKAAFAARQAADDLKINYPTDQATLVNEAIRNFKLDRQDPQSNEYQRDTSYTSIIKALVTLNQHGSYKVGFLEFPFSRFIVAGQGSDFHNINLINQDITYAKAQAEKYRTAVADNKQPLETLADAVRADPRLGYGQAGNTSEVFYADESGNMYSPRFSGNMVQSYVLKAMKQAEVGKVSDIKTMRWSNDTGLALPSIQHDTDIDVAYYFIIVQSKTQARPNLEKDFNTRMQGYL